MDFENHVKCISCGHEMMRPVGVEILNAGKRGVLVSVTAEGLFVDKECLYGELGRGVKIKMTFSCEQCFVLTEIVYWFHKGTTYIETCKGAESYTSLPVIWRD